MKSWILSHKILAIVLACVLGAGVICAVVLPIALAHKHEFSTEWSTDENYHWHKCKDEKCNEVADKAAHVFDKEIVSATYIASAATYTDAAKYYKSCVCGVKGTETFEHGSSLSAKENVVGLKEGVTLGKVYDGEAYVLAAEEITRNGNGEVTVMYQRKGGVDFGNTAPKNVGEYTVKVSVAATAEWKEAEKTFDFAITAKPLTVTVTKEYDGNAVMPATLTGVVSGDDVTVAVTMESKNVGATVKEVVLDGAAKDNYTLSLSDVDASITAKPLTVTATKEYDGNAVMPATLTGVIDGETVTVAVTMESKNVGATVKEVVLDGKDKDNYTIETDDVDASITPMPIGVDWEHEYNNSKILTGEPAELLEGDEATITVTMESANVGAAVQSFEITGKDAGNYSLAEEDVNVEIIKANISGFEISNAAAFEKGFYVGATNIPEPTTNYVEIGIGYGERTIVWEMQLESGVWSRNLTKEEVLGSKTGTFRVHIKYAEGDNYKFGDAFVKFTMNVKPRSLTVRNFEGKTYDGKQVTNFTFDNLVKKFGATTPDGVENFTSAMESGEKYVEFREVGGEWGRNLNVANVLTNAAEYEYRIGVTATDEWAAVVSEVKTFTIKPYEFVLELGYGQNQNNESLDGGKTFILRQYENLIEGQKIQLWLDNEKAGLETEEGNNSVYNFIPDQKKKVTTDCFFLKIGNISNPVMENYKIVPKYPNVTTVEMTVVEYTTEKSTSGSIIMVQPAENWIRTNVEKGYFKVGQTVVVYKKVIVDGSATYVKAGEATITEIRAGGTTSASGFAIPSDGTVIIVLDKIYDDILSGKIVVK